MCRHISRISRGKHSPATCLAKLLFAIVFLATLPHTNRIHCSLSLLLSLSLSLSCALCLSCQKHTAKQVPALSPGQALPQVPLTGHKHVQININSGQEQEREEERGRRAWAWAWVMCLFVYFEVFAHYVELGHGCSRRISSSTRLGPRCELRCAVNMF